MKLIKRNSFQFIQSSYHFNKRNLNDFKKTFNYLKIDNYHKENENNNYPTRLRKYRNYDIKIHNNFLEINKNNTNCFQQNVNDKRKNKRFFPLIEYYYHPIIIDLLNLGINHTLSFKPNIKNINISVHQIRQITYPNISSHNSLEGIHKDGCDFIISAFIINKYNIDNGISSIYDNQKNIIFKKKLEENEYIFQNDKNLFHYVNPIYFNNNDNNNDNFGYRDIIGLDMELL